MTMDKFKVLELLVNFALESISGFQEVKVFHKILSTSVDCTKQSKALLDFSHT